MAEDDFEDHARQILKIMKRENAPISTREALEEYLKANFGNPSDDDASPQKNPVGRPRKGCSIEDLVLPVAVFGDREAEIGLRKKVAEEFGFDKNTAKARIAETREVMADQKECLRQVMDDNGLSSLIRKR